MSNDKVRAEFEAWWRREYGNRLYCESAWWGWQASRASLAVELPEVSRQVTWDDESIDVFWPNEVRIALESAGVRVKP